MTHVNQAVGSSSLAEPGIVSCLLQKADPFTLHISLGEIEEIKQCLTFKIKNFNDNTRYKFINRQDIESVIVQFSNDLDMDKMDLMTLICNGMLWYYGEQKRNEDQSGYWDLFEQQYYYMKTRGPLILEVLRNIGFVLGDNPIQYHAINPYNNREHAWTITAQKPTKT